MSTVNFSVPEDVKRMFDAAFKGRNKSAVIADLMRRAVEEEAAKARRAEAVEQILRLREQHPPVSDDAIRAARNELRS